MVDHVLVPMDDSPLARRALEFALGTHPGAAVTVLYVVDYVEESYGAEMLVGPEELRDRATERADRILADARDLTAEYGVRPTTVTAFGDPARTIVDYVDDEAVDLVVMGSHGRSLVSRALIGDTAYTVVRRASVPVTLVR
jgi:nucleotide-binding universal stress UspA family protein